MYTVHAYGDMIADRVRTDAYLEALRRTVTPQSVVLDIGTGTGFHALWAAKLGARRVYAIEPNDAIEVAKDSADANGLSAQIEFFQALSTAVDLPERADVMVSDLRGALPLAGRHLESIVDARERLLAPGGVMIPQRDNLMVAVAEAPTFYRDITGPWVEDCHGLDLSAGRTFVVNSPQRLRSAGPAPADFAVLTEAAQWATLDYTRLVETRVAGVVTLTVTRAGVGHGLMPWFRATLFEDVGFSTDPSGPSTVYGRPFLPWPEPVELARGDQMRVELRADPGAGDYLFTWSTEVTDTAGRSRASFRQSTFFATPISGGRLAARREDRVVELSADAQVDAVLLRGFEAGLTLGAAAERLVQRYPARYPTRVLALERAADAAERYEQG